MWPHTFVVCERRRKPLALGIDKALLAAAEPAISADAVTVKVLKAALRRYVSAEGYLRACRRAGTARIDLTADIAGTVTEREANFARQMLAQRRRKKLAAAANITSGRLGAGGSVGPNKTEGHGAPSRASVAKGSFAP